MNLLGIVYWIRYVEMLLSEVMVCSLYSGFNYLEHEFPLQSEMSHKSYKSEFPLLYI